MLVTSRTFVVIRIGRSVRIGATKKEHFGAEWKSGYRDEGEKSEDANAREKESEQGGNTERDGRALQGT